ncbi:MAG: restriction endonuclease subunit S [Dermatophilaceae bacterium]|nr:restriction endonuclease subunit S [Dermatophilaceae bacterium]MBP9919851.1 restriction endonuclease subunit S [Dermatophilaceae bacterium]
MTWARAALAEVATIISGATPKTGVAEFWDGGIPWATPKDLSELGTATIARTPRTISDAGLRSCGATILPAGSVLFSSRAPIGHVAINAVPMATNQGFKSLVPKAGKLNAVYLYHWFRANRRQLEALGNGATFKEVSKAVVSRVEIPLPPIEEQRRIAAILDHADELVRMRLAALGRADLLLQVLIQESLAASESQVPLKELADIRIGPFGSLLHREDYVEGGVPLINPMHIVAGALAADPAYSVTDDKAAQLERYRLREGDVVMGRRGEMGRCARVLRPHDGYLCGTGSLIIRPLPERSRSTYLQCVLSAPRTVRSLESRALGVTLPNLNTKIMEELPVPSLALDAQRRLEDLVERVDALRASMESQAKAIGRMFGTLQARAFSGRL